MGLEYLPTRKDGFHWGHNCAGDPLMMVVNQDPSKTDEENASNGPFSSSFFMNSGNLYSLMQLNFLQSKNMVTFNDVKSIKIFYLSIPFFSSLIRLETSDLITKSY